MGVDVEASHHGVGMRLGAVGEDQLAAGKLLDRGAEHRVGLQRRVVDVVHVAQELVGLHAVLGHQAAHRGAVALVVVLLQLERGVAVELEEIHDVAADALVHLLPQVQMMRIKRVVEVEDPGLDVGELARAERKDGGVHGRGL